MNDYAKEGTGLVAVSDEIRESAENGGRLLCVKGIPWRTAAGVDVGGMELDGARKRRNVARRRGWTKYLHLEGIYLLAQPVRLTFEKRDTGEDEVLLVRVGGIPGLVDVEYVHGKKEEPGEGRSPQRTAEAALPTEAKTTVNRISMSSGRQAATSPPPPPCPPNAVPLRRGPLLAVAWSGWLGRALRPE
jgi:hypothetical protein